MRKFVKRIAAATLALAMAVGMVTGCSTSKDLKTQNGTKTLFTYDGTDVTLKEAWIYAKMTGSQYDYYYSTYYGTDFWTTPVSVDADGNTVTFEENVKEQVVSQIKKIIVLNNKAKDYDVSLSDKEKKECEKYAKAFKKSAEGAAILKECGASEDDMEQIYEKNKIASKVEEAAVKEAKVDTNVSDDEARETTIARIVYATTTTDDSGQTVDMSKDEKANVLKTAQAALKKIQSGTSLADVAEDAEYTNTSETFAAGESEEGTAFEAKLAKMKDGDLMNEVMECDNGYVVAQLTAYTDKDATADKKEEIIAEREEEAFDKVYDEWTKDLETDWDYDKDVDQDLWKEVILHSEDSTATEAEEQTTAAADQAAEATTQAAEATTQK